MPLNFGTCLCPGRRRTDTGQKVEEIRGRFRFLEIHSCFVGVLVGGLAPSRFCVGILRYFEPK